MRRLLRFVVLAVVFGAGLVIGAMLQPLKVGQSADRPAVVEDLRRQVAALQELNRMQQARLAALPSAAPTSSAPDAAASDALAAPRRARRRVAEQPDDEEPYLDDEPLVATEEAALTRFHDYLEQTGAKSGHERLRQLRSLLDDLRQMGEVAVAALINTLVDTADSRERRAAAQILGALQDLGALPALQDALKSDEDVLMRRAAARGLRLLEAPETIPVLEAVLANGEPDPLVRINAAYGLAQLGQGQGVAELETLFDDTETTGPERHWAFRALASLDHAGALPLMRRVATADTEVSYRLGALDYLGRHGVAQDLPLLRQVRDAAGEQPSVVQAARRARASIVSDSQ